MILSLLCLIIKLSPYPSIKDNSPVIALQDILLFYTFYFLYIILDLTLLPHTNKTEFMLFWRSRGMKQYYECPHVLHAPLTGMYLNFNKSAGL